jgi:hypothetical protein
MKTLTLALQFAALTHLGLIAAGAMMTRVVNLRGHLVGLPPFIHRLFWVYLSFIGLCLVSFGTMTWVYADTLASGGNLARGLCTFLALFWTLRLIVAAFVFDVRSYITNRWLWVGYQATNIVFTSLPIIYGLAAIHPGWVN